MSAGGGLLRRCIERPTAVTVGVLLVLLFGALSIADIPLQLTPDISVPTLSVTTRWPGAAPLEVESEILEAQEDVLEDTPGLTRLESSASRGMARITLEFEVGTEIEETLVRVTNRLAQVSRYPDAAREPVVTTSDSTGPPLAVITVRARDGAPVAAYRTWVEDEILPQIERVPGVADIRLIGGRPTEVHVRFDPAALAARGISVRQLVERVRLELRDVSGGDLEMGKRSFLVRTPVSPETPEELERMVLGAGDDGTPIVLGDVARVRRGLREPEGIAFSDDRPSMVMLLTREAGTNVLSVTQAVHGAVAELQRERFAPEGLELEVVSDQTEYIEGALSLVEQNLLLGAAFAVLVLLLFLRSLGASLVVAIAIPVCVFATALGMQAVGRSVNVVSLAGVTFAIGMVLDNSIVALESIDTWRRRVTDPREAAYRGIEEVWGAVLASTLTTAAVFIPIVLWQGEVGELLRDVAVAVSLAVVISLAVSVLVIPSLAARLLRPRPADAAPGSLARAGARVRDSLQAQAQWLSRSAWRSSAVVTVAVGASIALGIALLPPLEYLPTGNRNLVFGIIVPPPGYSVQELERIGERVQAQMAAHTGVERDGVPSIERSFFVGSADRIFAGAIADEDEDVDAMMAFIRRVQGEVPGVFAFATKASLFGRSIGGGRSIELEVSGTDLDTLTGVAGRMMGSVREQMPDAQVRPIPSLDPGAPEIQATPRRDVTAALGLTASDLGLAVDAFVDGTIVGEHGPQGAPKVDVVVRADRLGGGGARTPDELAAMPVATPGGEPVPLGVLATLDERLGPTNIRRIERRRAITLMVSPPEDMPLESAIARLREGVVAPAVATAPEGVRFDVSGAAGALEIAQRDLAEVLLLALLICFLLIAALFEDFVAPLAVLVTIPLAAAGGIAALWVVDATLGPQPLDLMTALGFLILIGVVVNNAILVVDGALVRLRRGESLDDAVGHAVQSRVRPIFMTTATSLAGLLPMVVFEGAGSELYRGVGAIVLGGLALSTALTLYVVPTVFTLLWRVRIRIAGATRAPASPRDADAPAE